MTGDGIRPDASMEAVLRAVKDSGLMPASLNYIGHEPNVSGEDANIKLPVVTAQPVSNIRLSDFNTDRVDYTTGTDGSGNTVRTGRVFTAEYRLDVQLDIWVADGSSHDVDTIGNDVWTALYEHDSHGPAKAFVDENGASIESISKFQVRDGEPANNLTYTPAIRRWRQMVTLWAYHRFDTTEDYVATVDVPSELHDSDGDGVIDG